MFTKNTGFLPIFSFYFHTVSDVHFEFMMVETLVRNLKEVNGELGRREHVNYKPRFKISISAAEKMNFVYSLIARD